MSHSSIKRALRTLCTLAAVAAVAPASAHAADDRLVFSGQATAVRADVEALDPLGLPLAPIVLADTGYHESPEFMADRCTEQGIALPPQLTLNAEILCSSTRGQGNHSRSTAHVAHVDATVAGIPVSATLLSSRANASCSGLTPVLEGDSTLARAQVGELVIDADTPRNVRIPIPGVPGAYVIVDEQSPSPNGNAGKIDVTALHIVVPGVADVAIANVHADIVCKQAPPVCPKPTHLTGGGWLVGQRHFTVNAREDDTTRGHLMYSDKAARVKVRATEFKSVKAVPGGKDGSFLITGVAQVTRGSAIAAEFFEETFTDNGELGCDVVFLLNKLE